MFLYRYFREFAALSGVPYFSINNEARDQDRWRGAQADFIVCPLRLGNGSAQSFHAGTNVLHLRDPIDSLISLYFSVGWTHPRMRAPNFAERRRAIQQITVDEFCLDECANLGATYRVVMAAYNSIPELIVSDYSAMRDNFKTWNRHICRSVLGTAQSAWEAQLYRNFGHEFGLLRRLLARPASPEAITSGRIRPHRRDGRDGQKTHYLRPETIVQLERELKDVLEFFAAFRSESRAALRAVS